jgi:hypothetical protein
MKLKKGSSEGSTKGKSSSSKSSSSRPLPHECVAVCDALATLHGRPSLKRDQPRIGCEIQEPHTVLDSLASTASHSPHMWCTPALPSSVAFCVPHEGPQQIVVEQFRSSAG